MSKTQSKLGRNPLDKINIKKSRSLPAIEVQAKSSPVSILEKVRELQIQIDWDEFYKAIVEKNLNRFGLKYFKRVLRPRA